MARTERLPVNARTLRLVTCIGVEHDLDLLPHFVDHYSDLGLAPSDMVAILNTPDESSTRLSEARAFCKAAGITAVEWIAPYTSDTMWQKRREVQTRLCGDADWIISADIDEFHEYPEPLDAFLDHCEAQGVNAVQGVFVDRLARDGTLAPVATQPPIAEQFPLVADAMGVVGREGQHHNRHGTVKLMAIRPHILPARGGHGPLADPSLRYLYRSALGDFKAIDRPEYRFDVPTRVNHYHWTESLRGSLVERLANPDVSVAGEEYGKKQLTHIAQKHGFDPAQLPVDTQAFPRSDWKGTLIRMRRKGAVMAAAYHLRRLILRARA